MESSASRSVEPKPGSESRRAQGFASGLLRPPLASSRKRGEAAQLNRVATQTVQEEAGPCRCRCRPAPRVHVFLDLGLHVEAKRGVLPLDSLPKTRTVHAREEFPACLRRLEERSDVGVADEGAEAPEEL